MQTHPTWTQLASYLFKLTENTVSSYFTTWLRALELWFFELYHSVPKKNFDMFTNKTISALFKKVRFLFCCYISPSL